MTRALTLFPILCVFTAIACSKPSAPSSHERGDHAEPQATESQTPSAATNASAKTIPISVGDGGFEPSRVELEKGREATLRFTRTSDETCATKVVFPELKIEKDLPLNEAVDVEVPTTEARQLTFQCGMGMYKSAVVVN